MHRSILYISNSEIAFSGAESRITNIVEYSRLWNESVGITGALVFTERHFVQFIEGPKGAVGDLLEKLRADRRHSALKIIEEADASARYFERWSLAYAGPDTFIDYDLTPLLQTHAAAARPSVAAHLRSRLFAMAAA